MQKKRRSDAVSEIIGVIILLAIVTSVMALVFFQLSLDKGPDKQAFVKLVGKTEGTNLIVEHQGGDPLALDTSISIAYGGKKYSFIAGDIVVDENHNGFWNIGEKMIFPFTYDLSNLSKYDNIDIMSVDKTSNSIQFLGVVELRPVVDLDLKVTVSDPYPTRYEYIYTNLTLTCNGGDINGSANIKIKYLVPEGLQYTSYTSSRGTYNNTTGIWFIDQFTTAQSVTLSIRSRVVNLGFREFIQFVMILDGSTSIVTDDWTLMKMGLSNALANESVFPHDKSVELTVIQFGGGIQAGTSPHAEVVIYPTVINNDIGTPGYFQTSVNTIKNLKQLTGYTPMGCGIRLAADQLHNSINFSSDKKQLVFMVTDGVPNCDWISGGYTGQHKTTAIGKTTTEVARAYLNTTLHMDVAQDQFNVLAVGSEPDITWLNKSVVWPQPGHIAPPFLNGRGWVSKINTWQEFTERICLIFRILFESIPIKAQIVGSFTVDPNQINNIAIVIIHPKIY
jgi:uncharacterized protein YegL